MTNEQARKYLDVANAVAGLSKDASTRVGALVLAADRSVRSVGYNGAPRGCSADEDERSERPEKYYWFSHAELNAITNAARCGTPLEGCTLIVTHPPCMDCARAIVQAGIKEVWAVQPSEEFFERWEGHIERTGRLFQECGVGYGWMKE